MSRHLRILGFAVGSLLRSRARTAAVVSVYAALVGIIASLLLYTATLRLEAHRLLESAPEIVVQRLRAGRHRLVPVEWAGRIRQIAGVGAVTPRVWGYVYDPPSDATFTLWGNDSVPRASLDLQEGEIPPDEETGRCVIGRGVAEARFLWVGDRLPIKGTDGTLFAPRVVGIFTTSSALLTNDLVVLPTVELRQVFAMPEEVATDLAVQVHNSREVSVVAGKIQEIWPDARAVSRRQILQTYDAVFDWRAGLWAALLLSTIAAFAILVWDKASGLSGQEFRTLGVLKAVGWSNRDLLELKTWEGATVSVIALLTGVVAAEVHLIGFDGALFAPILKGWSVQFPRLAMAPSLDAYTLLLCLPLTVMPYVVASLLPSWRAAIVDPDSVMRS